MSSSAKTVSFISASGGVGKTTLSVFLAKWILDEKLAPASRLLLVDLDPTAGLSLSLMSERDYQQCVDDGKSLDRLYKDFSRGISSLNVEDYAAPVSHGGFRLNLLIPGDELDIMAEELWRPGNPGPRFRRLLERSGVYSQYDFVIFDSAPFFDMRYTVLSLYAASKYVVVLRPSLVDFRRTLRMLRRLMDYAGDFGLNTAEYLTRFLGVFNLVRQQTIESDTLVRLGFRGVSLGRSKLDERTEELRRYVEELRRLFEVSNSLIPVNTDVSRLELDKKTKEVLGEVMKSILQHVGR